MPNASSAIAAPEWASVLPALGDALTYIIPPTMIAACVGIICTLPTIFIPSSDRPAFLRIMFVAIIFSIFAACIAIFLGTSGAPLVTAAFGAVVTVSTTYISVIVGKDDKQTATLVAPGLVSFYITLPLIVIYWDWFQKSG